jgi:hypothetical protein
MAAGAVTVALAGTSGIAAGSEHNAFLCPIVGDGVVVADANNGDNGVENIGPLPGSGGASILPAGGENQAGANSNPNAHNTEGPGTSPGPGDGNSDWSPIWPAS